tara:strand:+ start:292 stop:585 length:294 start_codon:yes stop_codon:yes gene_type:complete
MKVHKFTAAAAIKIINELDKMQQQHKSPNRKGGPAEYKEMILQARDKWITGTFPEHTRDARVDSIGIHEQEDGLITVEFEGLKFRLYGDNVSKEQGI